MKSKLLIRFALGLFGVAGLIVLIQVARNFRGDIDIGSADTAGFVAAIQFLDRGSRAVLIDREGRLIESPGYVAGATDREIAWRPDGHRAFFSSDREERVFNIFRWNPGNGSVERRSFGSRAKGGIAFAPPGSPGANDMPLMISGGLVLEFRPSDGSSFQILPPIVTQDPGITGEGGRADRTAGIYRRIGESFTAAMFGPGRAFIAATMRREDGAEVFLVQSLRPVETPDGANAVPDPVVLLAGDRVDFDVCGEGTVVAASLGFQFPDPMQVPEEFIHNGVAVPPYRHALMLYRPLEEGAHPALLLATGEDDEAVAWPKLSPDGKEVATVVGTWEDPARFVPRGLVRMPALAGGAGQAIPLVHGPVHEPSWRPDGERLVFVMEANGRRPMFTIGRLGGRPERLGPDGDFGLPVFSPQTASR
jgi:hypothetical protein